MDVPVTPSPSTPQNRLARALAALDWAPKRLRGPLLTRLFTHVVRFAGTAGVRFEALDTQHAVVRLRNRRHVRNHIGTVHAAATALLAETASGAVFGLNLPAGRLPLLKSMHVDYLRRGQGDLRAVATLDEAAREAMRSNERGELRVPVVVTDTDGGQPVCCEMVWAWVPAGGRREEDSGRPRPTEGNARRSSVPRAPTTAPPPPRRGPAGGIRP